MLGAAVGSRACQIVGTATVTTDAGPKIGLATYAVINALYRRRRASGVSPAIHATQTNANLITRITAAGGTGSDRLPRDLADTGPADTTTVGIGVVGVMTNIIDQTQAIADGMLTAEALANVVGTANAVTVPDDPIICRRETVGVTVRGAVVVEASFVDGAGQSGGGTSWFTKGIAVVILIAGGTIATVRAIVASVAIAVDQARGIDDA